MNRTNNTPRQTGGLSRRRFLGTAAAIAASYFIPGASLGLAGTVAPSDRITLGNIGLGIHGMGWNLKDGFLKFDDAQVLAVCDVVKSRREEAREMVNRRYQNQDCGASADWRDILARDDIDAVVISTPDHWHTPMAAAAVKAGKDVCCEKPTLTIDEGRQLIDIVRQHKKVFQTSTEDRSIPTYHRMAELVRNGRIGKLERILVTLPEASVSPEPPQPAPVPDGFDYANVAWPGTRCAVLRDSMRHVAMAQYFRLLRRQIYRLGRAHARHSTMGQRHRANRPRAGRWQGRLSQRRESLQHGDRL